MSVSSFATGDKFIYRIIKSLTTNPSDQWVNTYEFSALETGGEEELLALGVVLVSFEQAMHHDVVRFDRMVISTWEPDSVPYDPAAFISTSLSELGTIGSSTALMALNTALSVARVAAFGRQGHLFYRGNLDEEEVSAPAGKSILTDRADKQTQLDAAVASSGLDDYIGGGATSLRMMMINADGDQVRPVVGLFAQGVSTIPTDHKWFNRSNIVVP